MKRIYLDYAATTPLDPRVEKAMQPYFGKHFGNPSSIHAEGVAARKALDTARTAVARSLEAHSDEVVFTSGGTEANNLAIFGTLESFTRFELVKPHVVTTNIEHASVLEPLRELERRGKIKVTYVPVEANGIVKPEKIIGAIGPSTTLVSVMYANNEIGTIQPIAKIGKEIKNLRTRLKSEIPARTTVQSSRRDPKSEANPKSQIQKLQTPIFHVDGCQAPLYLGCLVNALGVDLLTLDAHKIYGPKGVGALYVRRGTHLSPMLFGGGQERGLRSTTENVSAIVGLAKALGLATAEREKESLRVRKLRDHLYSDILKNIRIEAKVVLNGDLEQRLPNNLNISLLGVATEFLTLQLDATGISVSTKSSCLKDEKESYVVSALGGGKDRARSSLRFSLGRKTTKEEIEQCVRRLSMALAVA